MLRVKIQIFKFMAQSEVSEEELLESEEVGEEDEEYENDEERNSLLKEPSDDFGLFLLLVLDVDRMGFISSFSGGE